MRLPFGQAVTSGFYPKGLRRELEIKLFIKNNQIYLILLCKIQVMIPSIDTN